MALYQFVVAVPDIASPTIAADAMASLRKGYRKTVKKEDQSVVDALTAEDRAAIEKQLAAFEARKDRASGAGSIYLESGKDVEVYGAVQGKLAPPAPAAAKPGQDEPVPATPRDRGAAAATAAPWKK